MEVLIWFTSIVILIVGCVWLVDRIDYSSEFKDDDDKS
jgi:hypothetical protein